MSWLGLIGDRIARDRVFLRGFRRKQLVREGGARVSERNRDRLQPGPVRTRDLAAKAESVLLAFLSDSSKLLYRVSQLFVRLSDSESESDQKNPIIIVKMQICSFKVHPSG